MTDGDLHQMPFGNHASSRVDIKACVLKEHLVFQPVDSVSPVGRALLKQLLARRPSHRLTLEDLKDHHFFAGMLVTEIIFKTNFY